MRVPQCCLHLGILLAWLGEIAAFSMEDKCKFWAGKGYIGDPSDCGAWGYCQDNKLTDRRSCNEGLLFNFRDGTCKKASEAQCHPELPEICGSLKPGDYAADPANCRRFVKCQEAFSGGPTWHDCGEDQVFSNAQQTCIQEVAGCPQDNICSFVKDGSLLGDPDTCKYYFKCHNGFGTRLNCSAGRYFNRKLGHCQSWLPEHCSSDDETPPATPPSMDYTICSKYYQPDRSGEQRITDTMTCHGYYTCTSQFDLGKWSSCPLGQHFKWWSESCSSPEEISCSYDRCGNLNRILVATINTGCREYTVCHEQRSQRSEKCPEYQPYFDEIDGHCSQQFPNYRVCFMDG